MRFERLLICLCGLIYGVFLTNAPLLGAESDFQTPQEILTLSADSEKQVNFQGIRKFKRHFGEKVYTGKARVFHQIPDRWRLEFLEPEIRKGEILILDGKRFWRSPREKGQTFRHRGLRPRFETKEIERLVSNYDVEIEGEEEIAGRKAFVLRCTGKHLGRPSLTLWVDKENFLKLKEERLSPDGKITYSAEFEDIEFRGVISPQHFQPPPGTKMREKLRRNQELNLAQAASQLDFDVLLPKSLPQGFELGRVLIKRKGGEAVLHLAYTDGLAQISLFEGISERTPPSSAESQVLHQGKSVSINERGHFNLLRLKQNHVNITLISEIPRRELINMITSLEEFTPEEEGEKESGEHSFKKGGEKIGEIQF